MTSLRVRLLAPLVLLAAAACARPAADTPAAPAGAGPPVVLLHGLNRTRRSMADLAEALRGTGRPVVNLDYPSGSYPVAELTEWLRAALEACCGGAAGPPVDFVTHSLGGILVRDLRARHPQQPVGRVVMLAPPNGGSEVVDALGGCALFKLVTGPAGQELGTGADSVPARLGPVDFPLGVVAGRVSLNPLYSWLIPGEDDGTVAVARTRVAGMRDHVVVDASHTFIMHDPEAIRQTVQFIETGAFDHATR